MNPLPHISPEEFEEIENFLFNRLSEIEKVSIEHKITTDPEWAQKVDQVKLMILGIKEAAIKDRLQDYHSSVVKPFEAPVRVANKRKYWPAAASVIFLMMVGALIFFITGNDTKLFNTYYHPDAGLMTSMGITENYAFNRAMIDYKSEKYESAMESWKALQKDFPENDSLNYFIGSAALANGQAKESIQYFKKVAERAGFFQKDAIWYLALAYLKVGNKKEAIKYLNLSDRTEKAELIQKIED